MERNVLEKRMKMLNNYIQILLHQDSKAYPALHDMLIAFFEPLYDKAGAGGPFAKTVRKPRMNFVLILLTLHSSMFYFYFRRSSITS